jgi:hypothetical protein
LIAAQIAGPIMVPAPTMVRTAAISKAE